MLFLYFSGSIGASPGIDQLHYNYTDTIITEDTLQDGRRPRGRRHRSQDTLQLDIRTDTVQETVKEQADTLEIEGTIVETDTIKEKKEHKHSPGKAAMLSATFPGLGQIYNKKIWKVPIVYAGLGAAVYAINFNNTEYQKFRKAYTYRVDGNPNTIDDFPEYSGDVLKRAMDFYRRNLEISYIAAGIVYVLNILDATVDAHLFYFDVSEDLSLNIRPGIIPSATNTNITNFGSGIVLSFKF